MADSLIETMLSNPYDSIIEWTNNQMLDLDEQIQELVDAINKLETKYPTSTTLNQLRERLNTLQAKKESLSKTNSSAKSLSQSFNQWASNLNTLQWIYDVKEKQLQQEKKKADADYKKMEDDIKRSYTWYINALWNATASENAIINANAWRQWASQQSTAEVRARNYLNNAQAQKEAYNNLVTNINAIEENRLNSNAWYTQLSQANADNYLRQQAMNDYQTAEADKDRTLQYWSSSWSWGWGWSSYKWWSSYTNNSNTNSTTTSPLNYQWPVWATDYFDANYQNWAYWNITKWNWMRTIINIKKAEDAIWKLNNEYNEDFNTKNFESYTTDKWYIIFVDDQNRKRVVPLNDVWYQKPMQK